MKDIFGLFYAAIFARSQFMDRVVSHRQRPHRTRDNREGKQRLMPARAGGNWQGVPYLSYAEHDRCTREAGFRYASSGRGYEMQKAALIASR